MPLLGVEPGLLPPLLRDVVIIVGACISLFNAVMLVFCALGFQKYCKSTEHYKNITEKWAKLAADTTVENKTELRKVIKDAADEVKKKVEDTVKPDSFRGNDSRPVSVVITEKSESTIVKPECP
jgi:hypothetical protein